jgi:hypothetical protein
MVQTLNQMMDNIRRALHSIKETKVSWGDDCRKFFRRLRSVSVIHMSRNLTRRMIFIIGILILGQIKHDSEDQPISDRESPDNDENYHDFRSDYPVSVDHDSRSISRFEDDDTKYNYPADVGYGSWNLPKFENNDTQQVVKSNKLLSNKQLTYCHCDSSSKRQSSTTSVTKAQSKDDYYHSNEDINTSDIKHASVRRYSLTDSRQPNQSTRSKPPVTNDGKYRIEVSLDLFIIDQISFHSCEYI